MADKPSRSLVIYGDGYASLVSPSQAILHSFASQACCGFLSLRASPPTETNDERVSRELAQLLDAYDFYLSRSGGRGDTDTEVHAKDISFSTIPERFMGLKAALVSSEPDVRSFAKTLGFNALRFEDIIAETDSHDEFHEEVPDPIPLTSQLLRLLGFSGGDVVEQCEYDLVFLHIRSIKKSKDQKEERIIKSDVDWLNKLVGAILQTAQPGSRIASRLHTSIALSYGTISEGEESYSLMNSSTEKNSDLSLLRPRQSYTMKGGHLLDDIRHHHPMLLAQWQDGVTRKDMAKAFSFEEFKEHGGNLAILADRFLHEVAFKLWKAPKYGA